MNPHKRLLFLLEIETQARFALRAARNLRRAISRRERAENFWFAAQALLVASANVSKLLWGNQTSRAERNALRELLGVDDDSPLLSRSLRNHFEHFDERVDRWFHETQGELNSVDLLIGDADDATPDELFRGFDIRRETFLYGAERYELEPIVHALEAVHTASEEALPDVWAGIGNQEQADQGEIPA